MSSRSFNSSTNVSIRGVLDKGLRVAIYRDYLLPASETFVAAQAGALQNSDVFYVGTRLVDGIKLPHNKVVLLDHGGLSGRKDEIQYKLTGHAPAFAAEVARRNPSLIHAHFGPGGVNALHLSRKLNIPLITTFHGFDATMYDRALRKSSIWNRLYVHRRPALAAHGTLFIAVSNFIKRKLTHHGFPEDRILVHYVGIDAETFCPDPLVDRQPIVLFVGRLVKQKGCDFLISAMEQVQSAYPDSRLVVIGDGPERMALERLAHHKLIGTKFLGVQPPPQIRHWLNRASVFSVPTTVTPEGSEEALGLVFAEALAMMLPVVAFSTGGVPEIVKHGENGFLAVDQNWNQLAEYLLVLLNNPERAQQFARAGRLFVLANHNLRTQSAFLEEVYASILQSTSFDLRL